MTLLEFLNKVTNALQPLLGMGAIVLVIILAWGYVSREDYEEGSDTVTITFRCSLVLAKQNDYPDIVITECKNLRNAK